MARLYNLARMSTATTGTGTITLGSAVSGYLSFAGAGVSDGETVSYGISDGSNSEVGTGTYTSSGTTLTRSVTVSTNSNAAISLSGSAQVYITARAEDFGRVLLQTKTASSSSSLDFTVFDSTRYAYYELALDKIAPATNADNFFLRCSTNSGSTFDAGSNYDYARSVVQTSGAVSGAGAASDTGIVMAASLSSTVSSRALDGIVRVFPTSNYTNVNWDLVYTSATPNFLTGSGSGRYIVASANAFRVLMSSGNIASGTGRWYGIAK